MKLRRYESGDKIKSLISRSVMDVEPEHYSKAQQKHLEEVIPDMNLEFAGENRYTYFVALRNNEVVGVAGFQNESGTVSGIFVDPELKGLGIGSSLLEKIEEKAQSEGIEEMKTLASLEATDFYKKNGYKSKKNKEQDIEGENISVKIMRKKLKVQE